METNKILTVAAVVVTYNRLSLLKECIEALRNQSRKADAIIVVNNGSTDGTKEYLEEQSDISVINQDNLGGAGGFYSGTKFAYDKGYDWVWMMDDDGLPANNQLEELLKAAEKHDKKFLNALVISQQDHTRLAFGDQLKLTELNLTSDIFAEIFCPFNGTFIHRSVMDKVGFIKKEMFIWGDEQEYRQRIIKAGYTPYTATKAIHYHPDEKGKKVYALPFIKKGSILVKPPHLSHYYYRNLGYIRKNYFSFSSSFRLIIYHTIYFIFKGNISELRKFYKYFFRGVRDDYSE